VSGRRHSPSVAEEGVQVIRTHEAVRRLIENARADKNAFMEFVFDKPDGTPLSMGWLHRQWNQLADKHPRFMIVAPRGHMKTTLSIGRVIHELGTNPNHLIKFLCQSDAKAVKRLSAVREHLRMNERIHAVFPHLKASESLEWNKHMITVPRVLTAPDPSIEALGITSSASGDRATLIVADDVVDRRNAITLPKIREQIKTSWDDWVNLLLDEGRILYICTLWSESDLTHELMKNPGWAIAWYEITSDLGCYAKLPDGTEWRSKQALWGIGEDCPFHGPDPAKHRAYGGRGQKICTCGPWSTETLRRRREELGPRQFARGFSNRPSVDEEQRIHKGMICYWRQGPDPDWPRIVCLDCAPTAKKESDWTGVVAAAFNPEARRIMIIAGRKFHINFMDKIALVKELMKAHRPEDLVIELQGGGRELAEWLVENTEYPVRGIKPRGSKLNRLDRITPYVQSGVVQFSPDLEPGSGQVNEERGDLITDLLRFGAPGGKDIVDAFVHTVRYITLAYEGFGPSGSSGPTIGDEEDEDEGNEVVDATSSEWDGGRVSIF